MSLLFAQALFDLGDETYSWADAIGAARLRGELAPVLSRAAQGVALLEQEGAGQLSEDAIANKTAAFRYERNLETAEEMEAWLERWGLSVLEWSDWIAAECLRGGEQPSQTPKPADPLAVARAVHADMVCSRQIERFALCLAERAAVRAWRCESGESEPQSEPLSDATGGNCDMLRLARDEASFRAFLAAEVPPQAKEAEIVARRLDWARLSYETAVFETADAAHEASFTIREDGLTLREAASLAGAMSESHDRLVDELDDAIRDAMLGARPREVLGPRNTRAGFELIVLVDRQPASIADPKLWARADRIVRNRILAREVSNRVRWRWRF